MPTALVPVEEKTNPFADLPVSDEVAAYIQAGKEGKLHRRAKQPVNPRPKRSNRDDYYIAKTFRCFGPKSD